MKNKSLLSIEKNIIKSEKKTLRKDLESSFDEKYVKAKYKFFEEAILKVQI